MRADERQEKNTLIKPYNILSKKLKALAIAFLLTLVVSVNAAQASSGGSGGLSTVYHVYIADRYIGVTTDKDSIEDWISSQKQGLQDQFADSKISFSNEMLLIPEQVFNPNTKDKEIFSDIKESVSFQTDAKAVEINGKQVAYLVNDKAVEEMKRQLKLSAVSKEELMAFEMQSTKSLLELNVNETRIIDIEITGNTEMKDVQIEPAALNTASEAASLLLKGAIEEKTYQVQEGDVLGTIASDHALSETELLVLNPALKADTVLQIGQELKVTALQPLVSVKVKKEKRVNEVISFNKEVIEDDEVLEGESRVQQEGYNGEKTVTYEIQEANGTQTSQTITAEPFNRDQHLD
ncbi:G5 domain-containing protein [Jeotgalibacillus soli]|uniref:LysM domain-containing protein n=1 Tax=Jeotgalibacillus soli TaxID=889306 RepID=A0A0C2VK02_9BACL|nr:G5 domain-containing protein [Jeotgalibacillus soli]KIL49222.1 hypothetical protein KP78_06900 [Jeotgalibacillus soli]